MTNANSLGFIGSPADGSSLLPYTIATHRLWQWNPAAYVYKEIRASHETPEAAPCSVRACCNAPALAACYRALPRKIQMKKTVAVAMLSSALVSLAFVSSAVHAQAPAAAASERVTVIRAGTLIDGSGGAPRKNQWILVRGNRIEKVAEASAAIPSGAAVIDLSSATVLPGMIDSHTHI